MSISDDEIEDFQSAIQNKGLDVGDFDLKEQQEPPPSAEIYAIAGKVTITRKSTGKAKTYDAGHGTSWPAAFAIDLDTGVFG